MRNIIFILTLLFFTSYNSTAQLRTSKLFSDNAVLQRDQPIKIWGWANASETISIFFNEKKYTGQVNENGKWMITLPAMSKGGPYQLEIKSPSEQILLKNILIGDVWICSGQSNMEWTVEASNHAIEEIENANDSNIRHFKIPNSFAKAPEEELVGGEWEITNTENVAEFTAVGYYFAKELRKHVDVPIGLLNTSWGGSRIEPWMSAGALNLDDPEKAIDKIVARYQEKQESILKDVKEKFPNLSNQQTGMKDGKIVWENLEKGWTKISVPNIWEQQGYDGFDGIAWYLTSFELTAEEINENLTIGLAKIDDSDMTFVNQTKVGESTMEWNKVRLYEVPSQILKVGKNTITIRVEDTGGGGGIHGTSDLLFVKTNQREISLAGEWDFRLDAIQTFNAYSYANQIPTMLYNKMIFPIKNYGIKGALWYQGESNAGNNKDATAYEQYFSTMIKSWRNDFGVGDFPFLFVQLANWLPPQNAGVESHWATLRQSQTQTLNVKNTAQAVIIDIGEEEDIHPGNKQDVGLRLSLAARNLAYGQEVLHQSPMYLSHKVMDEKMVISFQHVGEGLQVKNKYGYINGFAIAGEDKKFVWAKAQIIGKNQIVIWSEKIINPKHVRYAWADNPEDVNLYNSADLPVCPFRIGE